MALQPLVPDLAEDVVREILLLLPPDDPACLLRAFAVSKSWRRIVADPEFRRRHRELHPSPLLLGYLRIIRDTVPYASRFVPIDPASRRPAARDLPGWLALNCRHGRALFATPAPGTDAHVVLDFIVWNPLTGERRRLPRPSAPPTDRVRFNAAVLCDAAAAEGCDHRGCHRGPFRVILLCTISDHTSARVYSSTTDNWSDLIYVHLPRFYVDNIPSPNALVEGDALYFRGLARFGFEYNLRSRRLSVISQPRSSMSGGIYTSLVSADDGQLRFANLLAHPLHLCLWSTKRASNGLAKWVLVRTINLETLLPEGALLPRFAGANVAGFAEGTDVIFVVVYRYHNHRGDVDMVQLNSGRATKLFEGYSYISPYTSFCIPASMDDEPREGATGA